MPESEPLPLLVLLAAGRSQRMGQAKAFLPFGAHTWLEQQLQWFAAAGGHRALVVLSEIPAAHAPALPTVGEWQPHHGLTLTLHLNPYPESGPLGSLLVALEALKGAPSCSVLIQPVDVPLPDSGLLRSLLIHPLGELDSVQPTRRGRRGHPLRIGPGLAAGLARLDPLEPGQRLDRAIARRVDVRHTIETDSDLPFLNLNAPADWAAFLRDHPPSL